MKPIRDTNSEPGLPVDRHDCDDEPTPLHMHTNTLSNTHPLTNFQVKTYLNALKLG